MIIGILAILAVLITACGHVKDFSKPSIRIPQPSEPKVCTQDAKLCPDGSYVGRDPDNNCQIKPCPNTEPTPSPTPTPQPSGDAPEKPSFDFGQGQSNNLGSLGGQS